MPTKSIDILSLRGHARSEVGRARRLRRGHGERRLDRRALPPVARLTAEFKVASGVRAAPAHGDDLVELQPLAMRQALEAAIRYGFMQRNPAKLAGPNPMPSARDIRVYAPEELRAIVAELGPLEAAAVRFAASTGMRPAEWASLERRDVDKARRVAFVRGTKTSKSRREVPLTREALAALGEVPPRLDSRYVFTTTRKVPGSNEPGPFDVHNFRRRVWAPAIESAGIAKPARIYDLRSTFISNALASGLTVFETARIAGTSVKMIELHYGALLDTAHVSLLERLEAAEG